MDQLVLLVSMAQQALLGLTEVLVQLDLTVRQVLLVLMEAQAQQA
jgi:hypothetical protein